VAEKTRQVEPTGADVSPRMGYAPEAVMSDQAGEMRASGVRGVLIYCADHKCSHSIEMSADRWAEGIRLSDIEDRFVCNRHGGLRRDRARLK
jgi:hypothetical protein